MTEAERIREWVNWYKVSSPGYQANALLAVLRNDGEGMLRKVLGELGLTDSAALLKAMANWQKYD